MEKRIALKDIIVENGAIIPKGAIVDCEISHESDHIVNSIFSDLAIDIGYEHDEHHAYMLGWVAECIGEGLGLKVVKEE